MRSLSGPIIDDMERSKSKWPLFIIQSSCCAGALYCGKGGGLPKGFLGGFRFCTRISIRKQISTTPLPSINRKELVLYRKEEKHEESKLYS